MINSKNHYYPKHEQNKLMWLQFGNAIVKV